MVAFKVLSVFMMFGLMSTGCMEEESPVGITPATSTITAKIDGAEWRVTSPSATRVSPPGTITIVGVKGGEAINITLEASGVGSYELSGSENSAIYTRNGVQHLTRGSGGSGSVIVTKFDAAAKLISGTFTFTARNGSGGNVSATEGVFTNVKWSDQ